MKFGDFCRVIENKFFEHRHLQHFCSSDICVVEKPVGRFAVCVIIAPCPLNIDKRVGVSVAAFAARFESSSRLLPDDVKRTVALFEKFAFSVELFLTCNKRLDQDLPARPILRKPLQVYAAAELPIQATRTVTAYLTVLTTVRLM